MVEEQALERRVDALECQLRIARKVIATIATALALTIGLAWLPAPSAAQSRDGQFSRIDAQVIHVGSIVLQDAQGQMKGRIESGALGTSPRIELLGDDKQQRVLLSADRESGRLYLSGGQPNPSISLYASGNRVFPTGLSVRDEEGVLRVSAGITPPGDMGSIANIELKSRNDRSAVYMSAGNADGRLQVSATNGSIRLSSKFVSRGQSEPRISVWETSSGKNSERIVIGIADGQPKMEVVPSNADSRVGPPHR